MSCSSIDHVRVYVDNGSWEKPKDASFDLCDESIEQKDIEQPSISKIKSRLDVSNSDDIRVANSSTMVRNKNGAVQCYRLSSQILTMQLVNQIVTMLNLNLHNTLITTP